MVCIAQATGEQYFWWVTAGQLLWRLLSLGVPPMQCSAVPSRGEAVMLVALLTIAGLAERFHIQSFPDHKIPRVLNPIRHPPTLAQIWGPLEALLCTCAHLAPMLR